MHENKIKEIRESAFMAGFKRAWLSLLSQACSQLGYDDPAAKQAGWIKEREETILMLRQVCEEHGDNDWEDDLYLADVIEKHLANHLQEA